MEFEKFDDQVYQSGGTILLNGTIDSNGPTLIVFRRPDDRFTGHLIVTIRAFLLNTLCSHEIAENIH
jgi:hypothetical protein